MSPVIRPVITVIALMSAVSLAGGALAHAFLEQASPRVGSKIAVAPAEVRLSFSEPVEPAFSTIAVTGPAGLVRSGPPRTAVGDRRTLVAPLPKPMAPGRYRVRWRVISADTHVAQGDFQFELKP